MRRHFRVCGLFLIPNSSPSGIFLPIAARKCSLLICAPPCQGLPATLNSSGESPASDCIFDSNLHFSKGPRLSANRTHSSVHCPHPGAVLRGGEWRTSTRTGQGGRTSSAPKPREAASRGFLSGLRPNDTRQCQEPAVPVPARVPVRSSRDRRGPHIGTAASDRAKGRSLESQSKTRTRRCHRSLPVAAPPGNGAATGRERCAYALSVESLLSPELTFMRSCGPRAHRRPLSFVARCYYVLRLKVPSVLRLIVSFQRPQQACSADLSMTGFPFTPNDENGHFSPSTEPRTKESGHPLCAQGAALCHSRLCAGGDFANSAAESASAFSEQPRTAESGPPGSTPATIRWSMENLESPSPYPECPV
jgi:hypothetical protein